MRFRLSLVAEYALVFVLGGVLLALISIDARNLSNPLGVLRLILGLVFVLLLPGYYVQLALFPEKSQLDTPERIALSLVLSIAMIPPVALILDTLGLGLPLENIVISQAVILVSVAGIAALRRLRVASDERFTIQLAISRPQWWEEQNQSVKRLLLVLLGSLVVVAAASLVIITLPRESELFTEFYLLGEDGLAEGFPRELRVGETATVTIGVYNREGVPASYHVEVWQDEEIIQQLEPFDVMPNERFEEPLSFQIQRTGTDIDVRFLLFRSGVDEPYRTLRLWINVR
jgi:uncharacterized membrane protein